MKKIISLTMTFIMLFSFCTNAFSDGFSYLDEEFLSEEGFTEDQTIELYKEIIRNMNEYEKYLFLEMIQTNIEEQELYKTHIDNNYDINYNIEENNTDDEISFRGPQSFSVQNIAKEFAREIEALRLPSMATSLFKSVAASLATSIADGPLPVGEIATLITGVITIAYLVANWDTIGPKWDKIVNVFTKVFSKASSSVSRALTDIKNKVLNNISSNKVSVSGKTITVGNAKYECTQKAESIVHDMTRKKQNYFPAVRYRNYVWICPKNIDKNTAQTILKLNSDTAGVFAATNPKAKDLCSGLGGPRGPEGEIKPGYWRHYHPKNYPNAHIWFAGR